MYHLFVKSAVNPNLYSEDGWVYSGPVSYHEAVATAMKDAIARGRITEFKLVDIDKEEFYNG